MIRGDEMETDMMQKKSGQINIVLQNKRKKENEKTSFSHATMHNPFAHIDKSFSSFIGMNHLKSIMKEIYASRVINQHREQIGVNSEKQVLHMLFKGNPGTGKTTIARKLGNMLKEMEVLSKGHFIEVERADLVGEYIGQTAQKTRTLIQKALGGVLFIDEAYSLARGGEKDFGKEAIDTIVAHMENSSQDFVLILAGYPNEMDEFLALNPGLASRFPFRLDFPDFSCDHLLKIASQMASDREYKLTDHAMLKIEHDLKRQVANKERHFANARYVRNMIEEAIRMHAVRLMMKESYLEEELMELTAEDIRIKEKNDVFL